MLQLKHGFTSPKLDDLDATLVQPSDWNDTHELTISGLSIIGKHTAGTGAAESLLIGEGLVFDGASLRVDPALLAGLLTFPTRADYVEPPHPSLVLVQADETRGGIVTLYMYDGVGLAIVPTTADYALAVEAAAASASEADLSAASAAASLVSTNSARDITLATFVNFEARYLGPKSANPALDNHGAALTVGALYYNTTALEMRQYNGSTWTTSYMTTSGPFNGPLGTSAPAEAHVTTLEATGALSGAGFTSLFASPPPIGATAPAAGAFTTLTAQTAQFTNARLTTILESGVYIGTGATGALSLNTLNGAVLLYSANATGAFSLNIRGDNVTPFDDTIPANKSTSVALMVRNGATPYALTSISIDGAAQSIYWQNGTGPSGNANAIDVYSIAIFKTSPATFLVLASQSHFV